MPALAPSPHVRTTHAAAPLLMHPCLFIRSAPAQQTSGFTDVTITACTSQARTHTQRSRAASDAVAEPEMQPEPIPVSCSAPLASPESLLHPRRTTGGEVPLVPGSLCSPRGCADGAATQWLAPALPACHSVHAMLLSSAGLVARYLQGPQGKHGHPGDGDRSLESKCIPE